MFEVKLFDELEALYPDSTQEGGREQYELSACNGTYAGVHLLLTGLTPGLPVSIEVKGPNRAFKLFELLPVPVEVNTGARLRSAYLHDDVNETVIRKAPFYIYEALNPIFHLLMPKTVSAAVKFSTAIEYVRNVCDADWTFTITHNQVSHELRFTVHQYPCKVEKAGAGTHHYVNWINYGNVARYHGLTRFTPQYDRMLDKYLRAAALAAVTGVKAVGVGGEPLHGGADEPIGEGETPNAAVSVPAKGQVGLQKAVFSAKAVVAVGQQQPEGVFCGAVHLGGHLLGRFLVGIAVGVLNAGQHDGVIAAAEGDKFVAQIGDTGIVQQFAQLANEAGAPLMVAGNIVGGRDGGKPLQHRRQGVQSTLRVGNVAGDDDQLRLSLRHGAQEPRAAAAEFLAVQVAEMDHARAVPALGQAGRGEGVALRAQGVVAPPQPTDQQRGDSEKNQKSLVAKVFQWEKLLRWNSDNSHHNII